MLRGQEKSTTPNDEFSDRGGLESAQQPPLVASDDQHALTSGALDVDTRELQGTLCSVNDRQKMLTIIVFAEERCQVYFSYFVFVCHLTTRQDKTLNLHSCPTMKYHLDHRPCGGNVFPIFAVTLGIQVAPQPNSFAQSTISDADKFKSCQPPKSVRLLLKVTSTVCTKTDGTVKDMHPFPYTTYILLFTPRSC